MQRWVARIRGLLGLSAIGGGIGAILGAGWTVASQLINWGTVFGSSVVSGALFWGTFGALAAGGFGVLLTTLGARRSLDELPIWKAGLWGVLAGAAVPLAILTVLSGSVPSLVGALPLLGFAGGLGGLLSSGLVAMAKAAPKEEVGAARETRRLLDRGP